MSGIVDSKTNELKPCAEQFGISNSGLRGSSTEIRRLIYPGKYQKRYSAIKAVGGMRGDVIRLISPTHPPLLNESFDNFNFNLAYVPSSIVQTVSYHCISTLYQNSQDVIEGMHAIPSRDLSIVYSVLTSNNQAISSKDAAALDKDLMEIGGWSLDQLMELAGLSVSQAGKHLFFFFFSWS